MNRKVYCSCDSNFNQYYQRQAGSGFTDIQVFRGFPYQRGYGLGSLIKRFGVPILKVIGKHVLKTGVNVGQDVLDKKDFKESIKQRARIGLRDVANDSLNKARNLLNQTGKGMKRKKLYKKKKKGKKRKRKDVFD